MAASRAFFTFLQGSQPGCPPFLRERSFLSQSFQKSSGIGGHRQLRRPVQPQIAATAIDADQRGPAGNGASVVQAKIAGHARDEDGVGSLEGLAALVAHDQGMVAAHETARHAGEVYRYADLHQCPGQGGCPCCLQQGLAAHDGNGLSAMPEDIRRFRDERGVDGRFRGRPGVRPPWFRNCRRTCGPHGGPGRP